MICRNCGADKEYTRDLVLRDGTGKWYCPNPKCVPIKDEKLLTLEFGLGVSLQSISGTLNTHRLADSVVSMGYKPLFLGCFVVLKLTTKQIVSLPKWLRER